jgi:hypothetical protein
MARRLNVDRPSVTPRAPTSRLVESCQLAFRSLLAIVLPGGVNDERRHEDRCCVEIQHRGDDGLQPEKSGEQYHRPTADSLDPRPERGKQPVGLDHRADQQETCDKHERGHDCPTAPRIAAATLPTVASCEAQSGMQQRSRNWHDGELAKITRTPRSTRGRTAPR